MSRLPLVEPEDAPEKVREVLNGLAVSLSIFRLMALAENSFRPLLSLGTSILTRQQLDPKLRELAILQAAALTPGEYEWVQHVPIAKAVGASDERIAALERGELDAPCWSERERVALRFGAQAMRETRVDDALFASALAHFSPREIVELLITLGYYSMLARLTEVVRLAPEPPAGAAAIVGGAGGR
jgi:alkylhydroperoxidase family enzyme